MIKVCISSYGVQCGEWGCGEVEEEGGQDSCLAELCCLVRRGDAGS